MDDMVVKEMLDPVDRRCSVQDTHQVRMDAAHSTGSSLAMRLYGLIITSLGFVLSLLRQIYWCIASEEGKGLSKEIQRLKEGLSGIPFTVNEIKGWIAAQDTEHMDKLLGNQLKAVCRDFARVYQNPDVSLLLRSMLSKTEGPKRVSDVRDIAGIIGKHLELRRCSKWTVQDRNAPHQLKMDGAYSTRSMLMKMYGLIITSLGFIVPLLRQIYWAIASSRSQAGVCPGVFHPRDVKDAFCFVSRTTGDTGGAIPSFVRRIRRRLGTFKRRHYVIATGTSNNQFYIKFRRVVGLRSCTRRLRLLAATRRRAPLSIYGTRASFSVAARRCRPCPGAPPLWIYDTGSSISVTGNLSLLGSVHDADDMSSGGISGAKLVSSKCGRISGKLNLSGVRYFPGAAANLISAGLLSALGCETIHNDKGCVIKKDGKIIGGGSLLPNRTFSIDFLHGELLGVICPECRH